MGRGVEHAILKKAGPELDHYILNHVMSPKSGDVVALPGFDSGFKTLFVAVLAEWDGGSGFEERDLLNCYRRPVEQAQATGLKTLVIPALGRDKRDFPHIRFARLALRGLHEKLDNRMDSVTIMCADRAMVATYQGQLAKFRSKT